MPTIPSSGKIQGLGGHMSDSASFGKIALMIYPFLEDKSVYVRFVGY